MSAYSGRQHRGAKRIRKTLKRTEAETRNRRYAEKKIDK